MNEYVKGVSFEDFGVALGFAGCYSINVFFFYMSKDATFEKSFVLVPGFTELSLLIFLCGMSMV